MIAVRCKGCNRWLASVVIFVGAIKCPRCKMIFEYKIYNQVTFTTNTIYKAKISGNIKSETNESIAHKA